MKLLGCGAVAELDASYVDIPADWQTVASHHQHVGQ
jgi:hypothetical protein